MSSTNTIKKTLIDLGIDPKSIRQVQELVSQLEKLERAAKAVGQDFRGVVSSTQTREIQQSARNPVSESRKILEQTQRSARAVIDQLALEVGKGLSREQRKTLTQGLNSAFGEITGRFNDNLKKQVVAEKKKLEDFYREQFRSNPQFQRTQRLGPARIQQLPQDRLPAFIGSQQQFLSGAKNALTYAIKTGDKDLERRATRAVRDLDSGLQSATQRLKGFEQANREAEAAAKRAARALERKAEQEKRRADGPTPEQRRIDRRIEQIRQADVNRNLDGGASLFKNQAMLLRNYAVLGGGVAAGYGAGSFTVDLDREFKQLQSILDLTNAEMQELEESLIKVSEKTKFTATDVTEAAIVLGQAGFGKDDIVKSIEGVTLFATAVGSDLKTAVDLATSTLGVFNKDASQMVDIADQMTTAINSSKLNLDKLSLGLQYAGNLAAQSNITFEETVASLGAMANSGIRSGSTLGTGLRQILITLQNPTQGFKDKIHDLGISMVDLDISTRGLVPVLKTLAERGFTVRDAMEVMEVRAAAAYGAFANNIEVAEELQDKMRIGGAAARANTTQMEALSNQWARLGSISKTIVYEGLEPMVETLSDVVEVTADWLGLVRELGPALALVGTGVGSFLAVKGVTSIGKLGKGLFGGGMALASGQGLRAAGQAAFSGAPLGSTIGGAARFLGLTNPWVLGATALTTAGVYGYSRFSSNARATDAVDQAEARLNGSESLLKTYEQTLGKLRGTMTALILKQDQLSDSSEVRREVERLNQEFKNQGLYLDSTVRSYDTLMQKLREFEGASKGARSFLEVESRARYQEANQARLKREFGQGPGFDLFDSKETKLVGAHADAILAPTGTLRSEYDKELQFLNALAGGQEVALTLRNMYNRGGGIQPGKEGAYGATQKLREDYLTLAGRLRAGLNNPEQIATLSESLGLGDDLPEAKEFVEGLVEKLLDKANTLAQVAVDEGKFQELSPEAVEQRNATSEMVAGFIDTMNSKLAEMTRELTGISEEAIASKEFAEAYKKTQDKVEQAKAFLSEYEANARQQLKGAGVDNPERVLQSLGFYESEGQIQSLLKSRLRASAQDAEVDYRTGTEASIATLESQIAGLEENLGQNRNEEDSLLVLGRLKELVAQQEKLKTQLETFGKVLNDVGPTSLAKRRAEEEARVAGRSGAAERRRERTLASDRFGRDLDARGLLDTSQTKFSDSELSNLLSDFFKRARTEIDNQLNTTKIDAENLRTRAQDIEYQAKQRYTDAANPLFTPESRANLAAEAESMQREADSLRAEALALEEEGVREAKDALKDLADYIRTQVIDNNNLSDGESKTKSRAQVEDLSKGGIKLDKDLQDLKEQGQRLDQSISDNNENNELLRREISRRSPFEGGYREQVRGALYGQSYTPDGSTTPDNTYVGNDPANPVGNGINFLGQQMKDYYSAYDPLVETIVSLEELGAGMADSFGDAFANIATGAMSAEDAMRSMFASVLADLAKLAAKQAIMSLLASMFGGAIGGGSMDASNSSPFAMAAWNGGPVLAGAYKAGGLITSGVDTRDSTYAKVARGEFILRKAAVDALGIDTVRALNTANPNMVSTESLGAKPDSDKKDGGGVVNVWVVTESEKPAGLGAKDVLVIVNDDLQRNGQTKQLVKQIALGRL